MGVCGIGIDRGDVFLAGGEEVETQGRGVAVLARRAAYIPVAGAFRLAGGHNVAAGLCLNVAAVVPVHSHVFDKLEGVHVLLVVLYQVGGHLERTIHRDVEGQLPGERRVHMVGVVGVHLVHVHLKDAGGVVHRTALQTGERQYSGVEGLVAVGGLILGAAGGLVAYQVGPGAAQTGGAHCLVGIHHDVVLGGFLDAVEVVVVHPLSVVVLAAGYDVAHVAALHRVVAVTVHQCVGGFQMALVVARRGGGLMVHQQANAFLVGIVVQPLQVEVGVGGLEVEHVVLRLAEPVFPTDVPAFYQHLVETVLGGKVDVAAHIGIVGTVMAVGLGLRVVQMVELHGGQFVGVRPLAHAVDHLPPYAYILHGLYPTGVLQLAGLVQIQYQVRGEQVAGIVAHHDGAPGQGAGGLQIAFVALGVGGQPRLKHQVLVVQVQVHARIVHKSGLMDIDIEAIGGLHLQRGLHTGLGEGGLRGVRTDGTAHVLPDFRKAGLRVVVLLGVVVAGYPPGGVVAGHGKLGVLFLDDEIVQVLAQGKFVAQTETFVVETEPYFHIPLLGGLV